MSTFFASAERAREIELAAEIEMVCISPIVTGLLQSISGLLAVLNEHRQLVAMNDALSKMVELEDTAAAIGLRPGEALQCVHAYDEPAGCGTTMWCSTCGAAIAMVTSLEQNEPVEKICALSAKRGDKEIDIVLRVNAIPSESTIGASSCFSWKISRNSSTGQRWKECFFTTSTTRWGCCSGQARCSWNSSLRSL